MSDGRKPDIIAITEVLPKHCRYGVNKAEVQLDGYDVFPESLPQGAEGGVILLVKVIVTWFEGV
jgi:hypothetical protein